MRKFPLILLAFFLSAIAFPQYDIKIDLKNCKDTTAYLVVHRWESNNIVDSCKKVKNGQIHFKGKKSLEKGFYILVNESKNTTIFEFFVGENQKFAISGNFDDLKKTLKATGSKENELHFEYDKFFADKDTEFQGYIKEARTKSKADSAKFVQEKIAKLQADLKAFEPGYKEKIKGTLVEEFFALKAEKTATDVPKASNGRPDSLYSYYWYKSHYWDGVNLKTDFAIHTPYLDDKVKRYFDQVIFQHPDTVIQEIGKVMRKCKEGTFTYQMLIGHFTYKYESNKTMTFDRAGNSITYEKVFIYLVDSFIANGKAKGAYTDETVVKIKEKAENNRNILPGAKAPDIYVMDTTDARKAMRFRFDTCRNSIVLTKLYEQHSAELAPWWKTLHQVVAKYTVLVFWASDCGHCKTEMPRLNDTLKTIKGKIDFKVFAVQTKDDYEPWRKFIIDNKLDFINVVDPVHINSYKSKYDVEATPVIFLLDKDKRIKAKKVGVKQVVELLEIFEKIDKEQKK
jgi:peroxiredoxin